MNWGMPYQGSKTRLIDRLMPCLPSGERLVDLFAGGCSVTHAALKVGRWRQVVANDITGTSSVFRRLITEGLSPYDWRAVDKQEFDMLKNVDVVMSIVWSFGNDRRSYLWSDDIAPIKLEIFRMLTAPGITERRIAWKHVLSLLRKVADIGRGDIQSLERLQRLQSLQSLESLERLQRLQSLERLVSYQLDYRDVPLQAGDIVYCDPPYEGSKDYRQAGQFDRAAFLDWCRETGRHHPLYISEYSMPGDFAEVAAWDFNSLMFQDRPRAVVERLYTIGVGAEMLRAKASQAAFEFSEV